MSEEAPSGLIATPWPWPFAQPRNMRDARAQALYMRLAVWGDAADMDDLRSLTDGWDDRQLEMAVDDLVRAGRAELEAEPGHVVVWPIPEEAAAA